jgi:predicted  nucleic acid-binding Zn-ribbon protein
MLTNEDVLKDRISQLEGEIKYGINKAEEFEKLKIENKTLLNKINRLEKRIKYLTNQIEEIL